MPRKSDRNPAISGQIVPQLPFAVEPYHDLLTPAQERALAALLSARSLAAAARQARVPERTLRRWLRHDHDFQTELRQMRQEALSQAAVRLQQGASAAADTMLALLESDGHIELARAALLRTALDFAFRSGSYSDLTDRIAALEKLAGNQKR